MKLDDVLERIRTPHKLNRLLIEPSFEQGEFDSHLVDCATVVKHEDVFYMFYLGYDGIGYQTGLAVSEDLLYWDKRCVVFGRESSSYTQYHAALNCVFRDPDLFGEGQARRINGQFVGLYHAYPEAGYETGPAVIGLCFSDDLITWKAGDPILRPEEGEEWERGTLYKSWLIEHEGKYYLFYNAKNDADVWNEQIGLATSEDLVHWKRFPANPLVRNGPTGSFDDQYAADPCVYRYRDWWIMFYYGYCCQDGHARNGAAVSRDLLHWQRCDEPLIDVGAEGSIDCVHAHKPSLISHEGCLYHFYTAVSPCAEGQKGGIKCKEARGITFASARLL